jgi:hypothetical protein
MEDNKENITGYSENTQQFRNACHHGMTNGKVKGGTTGCKNVRSLQPSKQQTFKAQKR